MDKCVPQGSSEAQKILLVSAIDMALRYIEIQETLYRNNSPRLTQTKNCLEEARFHANRTEFREFTEKDQRVHG